MAIERKTANTKSSILQKAKNTNTKKSANSAPTATKTPKKAVRPNVRKKITDEEKLEAVKQKSTLNVNPDSPLLSHEEPKAREEILDSAFTKTEDGEDLKSINIGRIKKKKKPVEEKPEIQAENAEEKTPEPTTEIKVSGDDTIHTENLEEKSNESAKYTDDPISTDISDESSSDTPDDTLNNTPEDISENTQKKTKKAKKEKKPFAFTFTLSPISILTSGLVALVGLGIFFVFGLIVGSDLTPSGEAIPLESISSTTNKAANIENIEILKPEELQYAELKKVEAPLTEEEILEDTALTPATGATIPAPVPEAPAPPKMYDFSVRIVAYTNSDQADTLRARLEGDGYRTQLVTAPVGNKTWYYVHVNYRGTEENMKQIQADISKKYRVNGTVITKKEEI